MVIKARRFARLRARATLALLAAACTGALAGGASNAQAGCLGTQCVPGNGYTLERYWNCGLIYYSEIQACWYPAVLGRPTGQAHTWGWGSSDYDGVGTTYVGLDASVPGQSFFGGVGANLIRACYYTSCNDQSNNYMDIAVFHIEEGERHTIYGHALA